MSTTSDLKTAAAAAAATCITCCLALGPNYFHRGACGHHQHEQCALPAIRAGKGYCPRCPPPQRPTAIGAGTVVLGNDGEQIRMVAAQLRAEREVNYRSLYNTATSPPSSSSVPSTKTIGGTLFGFFWWLFFKRKKNFFPHQQ